MERFSKSPKTLRSPKKIYAVDNAFISYFKLKDSYDQGHLLENLVFVELKRRNKDLFYFKDKGECDFITFRKGTSIPLQAIQVTYELNKQNRDRELKGLSEAMEHFNLKEGLILTFDQEEEIDLSNKRVLVKPVWKWLIEPAKSTQYIFKSTP